MNNNAPIAFIDSGVGGLPYLQWVKKKQPQENFYYLADTENFPYGEKSSEEIVEIVLRAVRQLAEQRQPKMLVIACNTASVTALDSVRKATDIPVVGVVPAVKPAAEISKNKRIAVLATERTVNGLYLEELIRHFAPSCFVEKIAGSGIVRFVERDFFTSNYSQKYAMIEAAVNQLKRIEIDTVVLGCTHFIYLSEILKKTLGDNIAVIDSRGGVGTQILNVLTKNDLLSDHREEDRFYCTGKDISETSYRAFARIFGLSYWGAIGGE